MKNNEWETEKMDLDRYESEARQHCEELLEELWQYGPEKLSEYCRLLGNDTAQRHIATFYSDLDAFVRSTPAVRKRLLAKQPETLQPLFLLGALYHARCGYMLLKAVCRHQIEPGGPYRQMTARASSAASDLLRGWPSLWPFEDYNDPFYDLDS